MTDRLHPEDTARELDDCCAQLNELVEGLSQLQGSGNPAIANLERLVERQHERLRRLSESLQADPESQRRTPEHAEREMLREELSREDQGPCILRGSSTALSIPNVLELLSSHKKTGTLRINTERETFTLEIFDGDVVHACSDRAPKDQLLGSILVARSSISIEQLEHFFEQFTRPKGMLGDHLEREKLVSRADLQDALEHQVQMLFRRLFASECGSFFFHEGKRSGVEERIRMNITQLLLESARMHDEQELQGA